MRPLLLLATVLACTALAQWAAIPASSSWALLAWGDASPADSTDGQLVVDVDLDEQADMVSGLASAGHLPLCYFSAGTLEYWRPDTKSPAWQQACIAKMSGWNECWLNITNLPLLQQLLMPRFQRAVQEGCLAIEPDNVDCYQNSACTDALGMSKDDARPYQLTFNKWLSDYAHSMGLAIALKNCVGLVPDLAPHYDMVINESCMSYNECAAYSHFTDANKLVAHVEYNHDGDWCSQSGAMQTKWCDGGGGGDCNSNGPWNNCFQPTNPLPPITNTSATAAAAVVKKSIKRRHH